MNTHVIGHSHGVASHPNDWSAGGPCKAVAGPVLDRGLTDAVHAALKGGVKHDAGKPPMSLIDRRAMEELAQVLAFGSRKYAAHNWRAGFAYSRLLDAALRHIYAFADGEDNDPESGLSHVAHAMCCLMFLQGNRASGRGEDDRYKP